MIVYQGRVTREDGMRHKGTGSFRIESSTFESEKDCEGWCEAMKEEGLRIIIVRLSRRKADIPASTTLDD